MKRLDVYLYQYLVGQLSQDEKGEMSFAYCQNWLDQSFAIPLSQSLPLSPTHFNGRECRAYFSGLLPEDNLRKIIAQNMGVSSKNDFAILDQIGGECAGAVSFVSSGTILIEKNYAYRTLNEEQLAEIISELPRHPLLAGEDGIRLSLAGAQDKLAVGIIEKEVISIPLNNAPSTHILKPANPRFKGLVENEAFCLELANLVGLKAAKAEKRKAGSHEYLLVERYDRLPTKKYLTRLHQEDFCQALGIVSEMKYQREGGPSIADCFQLLRRVSSKPVLDLTALLDALIFNFLIGNNDAHGKNFSLLYGTSLKEGGTSLRIAPLYDLLCTVYYPELSNKMAMKIGSQYEFELVLPRHFEQLANDAGLSSSMVKKRVPGFSLDLLSILEKMPINSELVNDLAQLIKERCKKTLQRFKQEKL